MWTKGRVIALLQFACALAMLLATASIFEVGGRGNVLFDVIAFVVLAGCGITVAFRRKATLTTQHLVVRQLFRTRVLPLREIVNIYEHRKHVFTPNWVVIDMTDRRWCSTMSFGLSTGEAIAVIAKAAKAAGSPIDI